MHSFDQSWPHMIASLFLRSYTQFFKPINFQHLVNHLESICETGSLLGTSYVGSWDAAGAEAFLQNDSNPDFWLDMLCIIRNVLTFVRVWVHVLRDISRLAALTALMVCQNSL